MKPQLSGYVQGQPIGGPECEAFERELEAYYRVPHARVFNSGTSALIGALEALAVRTHRHPNFGTRVVVPVYSMSASAAAVCHAGAMLAFRDVGDNYIIDFLPDAVVSMFVHLFGHHGNVEQEHGPSIVHDCAQSPTLKPDVNRGADIWVYSLNQHKPISCGEGGYALTYSQNLADRLHLVRNHGESVSADILGYNFRMTELQAKYARGEFADLDNRIAARRNWAKEMQIKYDLPPDPGNSDWFLYPVRVQKNREAYAARIPGAKIGYSPLICDLPWFKAHGYGGEFPNARRIESEIVTINPEAYDL